jgi:hypothetical protein
LGQGETPSTEWIATTPRAALLQDGRRLSEGLLDQVPAPKVQLQPAQRRYRDRACEVLSIFGPVTLCRDYYHRLGPEGVFPLDRTLGLIGNSTPGGARMLGRTAAQLPYGESAQQMQELAGLKVDPSQIQRVVRPPGPPPKPVPPCR